MPNARSANAVRLEFAADSLVRSNLSGAAFTGGWLWVAGDEACGLDRLRRLDPVRRAQDGRKALRLKGDAQSNLVTRAVGLLGWESGLCLRLGNGHSACRAMNPTTSHRAVSGPGPTAARALT